MQQERYIKASELKEDMLIQAGHKIKIYGQETTVKGFHAAYNDALEKWETIILTEGRGDPFERSLDVIEVLPDQPFDTQPPAQRPAGCEWVKATDKLPGWGKYVKWRHESGKELPGQESVHSITDRDRVSLHGWEWYDESPSKEGNKEGKAIAFLAWIRENEYTYNTHNGGYWYEYNSKMEETYLCDTDAELYELFKQNRNNEKR